MTSNYRRNGQKTHRNNSLSILYLLCKLILFKENKNCMEESTREQLSIAQQPNELTNKNDFDISQKIQRLTLKDADFWNGFDSSTSTILDNRTASESTLGDFVTATEYFDQLNTELEMALLDFPLKHFYPQINSLIAMTVKVRIVNLYGIFL